MYIGTFSQFRANLCNWFAFKRKKLSLFVNQVLNWCFGFYLRDLGVSAHIDLPIFWSLMFLNITLKRPVSTSEQVGTSKRICVIGDINSYRMTCKSNRNQSLWTRTRLHKSCGWVKFMAAWLWHVWMDPKVKRMAHSATLVSMISTFHRRIFTLVTRPKTFTRIYHHPSWVRRVILHNSKYL